MSTENKGSFWTSLPGAITAMATLITALAGLHAVIHGGELTSSDIAVKSQPAAAATSESTCPIKGNVSSSSGEKIYHVPGDRDYEKTVIDESKGEKMFCSETDAQNEGWRRASQ
ncbi:MAG: hypothetical protein AAFY72_02820 [Cyanobacteria bacterium J06649_4]